MVFPSIRLEVRTAVHAVILQTVLLLFGATSISDHIAAASYHGETD